MTVLILSRFQKIEFIFFKGSISEIKQILVKSFKLSEDQQKVLLPSSYQSVFGNRVGWARTYLKKAKLISSPKRGFVEITDRGRGVLNENLDKITPNYLKKFEEFLDFQNLSNKKIDEDISSSDETPIELFEAAYKDINNLKGSFSF